MVTRLLTPLVIFLLGNISYSQNIWIQRDSVKGPPKANCASFVIGDDGFLAAGYDGFNKKRSMVSYDLSQDDWDSEVSLGGPTGDGMNRSSAVGFALKGFGYVTTGEGTGFMFKDLWKFDKVNDTWTQMADYGGEARSQAVSFIVGDRAYVGTGKASDFSTFLSDFWAYDPDLNQWYQVADFPGTARFDAVGISMVGKGYVGLGYDGGALPVDFWEYDPIADAWNQKADFPGSPRINATGFAIFPSLIITTGDDGFNYLNDTWEYNYFGDVWIQRANFPGTPRSGASSFVIENRGFVGTGFSSGTYFDDFYEYEVILNTMETIQIEANVFPNPAHQSFTVQLGVPLMDKRILLYNAAGQELQNGFEITQLSDNAVNCIVNNLETGTYYITIFDGNELIVNQPVILI